MIQAIQIDSELRGIVERVKHCAEHGQKFLPIGNKTKPHLATVNRDDVQRYSMAAWSGVIEYQPFEFTITAKSGTRISELKSLLEAEGQFLPFDPLFVRGGATLGGTIATGVSGPGRLLFGGLRDFVLGVQFIDGLGHLVRGGGKVVKNAAGFDLPKLMVGSLGRLGVLTEITLKVFPAPTGYRTLKLTCSSLPAALNHISALMLLPIDIVAIELDGEANLYIRIAGNEETTSTLAKRIRDHLGSSGGEEWLGEKETQWWSEAAELAWSDEMRYLVRVPLTLQDVENLDRRLKRIGAVRRYSAAANAVWIALDSSLAWGELPYLLQEAKLRGVVVRGEGNIIIGSYDALSFAQRIQRAIDPQNVFVPYQ